MKNEAAFFKALSYPLRLRIVVILAIEGEVCVCRLSEAMEEPEYTISRHLGILRESGVVETRRDGTWIYYSLAEPENHVERCLIECFQEDLIDHPCVIEDTKRLTLTSCNECNDDNGEA